MRRILILSVFALAGFFTACICDDRSSAPQSSHGRMDILVHKNFELCYCLGRDAEVSALLSSDPVLSDFSMEGRKSFSSAETQTDALLEAMFSDQEITDIGNRLSYLASSSEMKELCSSLRERGRYVLFNDLPDGEFLKAAWKQDAGGINHIISVYALGNKPRYKVDIPDPKLSEVPFYIDAMEKIVRPSIRENALEITRNGLFFSLSLEVALEYLDVNDRFEASDFEPMEEGVNAKAYAAVRKARWDDYPYSAILVLGSGPQVKGERISPKGRVRCAYAAELYRRGTAPFIILSGGRAHPAMTVISEAEEMKKYLLDNYAIPEEALIMEPHARHTTTNVRNAARIMYSYGFPVEKPALITSTGEQLDYVQTQEFENRCLNEMLVMPFSPGRRTSNRTLEFHPLACCTQVNPLDPLDP